MIGIDVSKDTIDCTFVSKDTREIVWHKSFPNTPEGVMELLSITPEGVGWVLEATGRYSLMIAKLAKASGQPAYAAPTRQAKLFCRSIQARAKTDRLDSYGLALFGLSRPLRPYPIKSESLEEVEQLLRARRGLSKALTGLMQRQKELPYARDVLDPTIEHLKERIKEIDKRIREATEESEELGFTKELRKVPGVGPTTAAHVGVALASREFERADQFVAYVGLDVGVVASGKRKGERGLTKQGDAELRRLLYCSAQSSARARKDRTFREQYEAELAKGLSKTGAWCAVARKIAKVCWALHRHGGVYDPERVRAGRSERGANRSQHLRE